ncbi:SDR family oxidoreductase [Duganella vulcania]|uniref:SDR family NAD(P)-dependent oxidoreductase n=1 Tax=Duganella vulcania TaxID=2692166 RepID=A0A845GRB3_9BURK|nr:SDR family oxidoreductase [Duganella vulcania]MYM97063.1 SDR family NAD(P)-dependent oxidoreductase [Duganella vulcania]
MKTVLITGCSSGFGLETASHFLAQDWKVIATMRTPRQHTLPQSEHLRVIALDVTDPHSIRQAIEAAGPIDVLVNNAGIGLMGMLEGTSMDTARAIFETNTIGTMAVTQAVLPQFRARRAGVIVNVTSIVTAAPFPLISVYSASKAAVDAFSVSLALELAQFDVRVRLVQPGRAPGTRFGEHAKALMTSDSIPAPYASFAQGIFEGMASSSAVTKPEDVAEAVWRAATDPSCPIRVAAGEDALALL